MPTSSFENHLDVFAGPKLSRLQRRRVAIANVKPQQLLRGQSV
ncbi:MAG: hypothetical protein ACFBSG_21045 [Leptolyngbyaceae cyanobacterium]